MTLMTYQIEYERLVARTYDSVYAIVRDPSGDSAFYQSMAKETGGPLLELGCGTGRILLNTAKIGLECVGLDASSEMLDVLREKNPPKNVALVHERIEDFELGHGRFRLITAPFRAMQHLLDPQSQLAALNNIYRHLTPEGVFVFDVFDPNLAAIAIEEEPEVLDATFEYQGDEMRRYVSVVRDLSTQIMALTFRFEGENADLVGSTRFHMRWYYRYEIEHLLARAGFSDVTFFRDFARTPWS
ncbi:MAG: class I SAM-dependent methyltransferase, partial [Gammaproteobacteria bacterium]|nr:class I SAM-dependent methyltransferase [Gammaproteobacteria bacterium]